MSELYEEILNVVKQRWPATYQVLSIRDIGTSYTVSAFSRYWYIYNSRDICGGAGKQLFNAMDLFEKYYGNNQCYYSSQLLPYYPYIATNFITVVSKKRFPHNRDVQKLTIWMNDVEINNNYSVPEDINKYGPFVDHLEAFLERLAKKREVLRPLPIPIRDAINYYL